jgi:hypothetical protein
MIFALFVITALAFFNIGFYAAKHTFQPKRDQKGRFKKHYKPIDSALGKE